MKTWAAVFTVILGILWIVGLSTPDRSSLWLTWFDGIAAVCSLAVFGVIAPDRDRRFNLAAAGAMGVTLAIIAILGYSTNGAPYQNGWTLVTSLGYFALAAYAYRHSSEVAPIATTGAESDRVLEDDDRFRRAG